MYEEYFKLRQRPFRSAPDAASYYPATGHEQAVAQLTEALADDEGVVLLSGTPGVGKTLLGHRLLEQMGSETVGIFLLHGHAGGRRGLLQAILFDLSLAYEGRGEQELRLAFIEAILSSYAAGKRTVLVVDEAHQLSPEQLEELRTLSNLEAGTGRAIQVVLLAQPSLVNTLCMPELSSLCQRLAVRAELHPLSHDEAADYLLHRIRAAGGRPEAVLSDEAIDLLVRGSQGVPRLLNQVAHQAFRLACAAEAELVDAEVALEALALLQLNTEPGDEPATEMDSASLPATPLFPPAPRWPA